ncbi:hypothetical protein R1sor_000677 [Riccia sorocarpa]|uniref:Uncharacterized protein n=1 Tax=Riccia sorocarpa TaxID=122646 RepID=A0ABD3GWY4_9MARC
MNRAKQGNRYSIILAEDETRIKPRVRWECRRDTLIGDKYTGLKDPMHLLGSDCCEHFFSRVDGMKGYERNYDFADLVDCASGLNRLASMEYGEEKLHMSTSHAKQQTIWGKLHPLAVDESEPDLSDFTRLSTDGDIIHALKQGFQQAQSMFIMFNMASRAGVTNQAWWRTPWTVEEDLGLFDKASEVAAEHMDTEAEELEGEIVNLEAPGDLWALTTPVHHEGSESEQEDGADDLAVIGHETRHVMSEVLQQVSLEEEHVKKYDPMVVYDGHSIYKATLVIQLVGNPTLSKDRLTRIKQSIYFNGVKHKPRVDGVPVCILDIGSDCAVLFNSESTGRNTRSRRSPVSTLSKDMWIGRAQKIRRKYNGKWGKTRTEVDLLDRPVAATGEGCIC